MWQHERRRLAVAHQFQKIIFFFIAVVCTQQKLQCLAFISSSTTCPNLKNGASQARWISSRPLSLLILGSTTDDSKTSSGLASTTNDDDDDDEYEYIEYETLTETDFLGSEWLVGTVKGNELERIDETWVRLAYTDESNIAIWGDGSEGKWNFDVASQFVSISKENKFWGKQIWACVVDDYYYLQGTVRGWNFISPASVLGQFQAKRLGLDKEDDPGVAPWFETPEEEEEEPITDEKKEKTKETVEEPVMEEKEEDVSEEEEKAEEAVDLSIPYDAAAKLAFEASDKSMSYDDFKAKYEADAVADVISKQKKD